MISKTLESPDRQWCCDLLRRADEAEVRARYETFRKLVESQPEPLPRQQLIGMALFFLTLGLMVGVVLVQAWR